MNDQAVDHEKHLSRFLLLVKSEHWLASYVSDLLSAHELSDGIDFATAQQLLTAEKEEYDRDMAIARRVLRLYGRQVMEEIPQHSGAAQASNQL